MAYHRSENYQQISANVQGIHNVPLQCPYRPCAMYPVLQPSIVRPNHYSQKSGWAVHFPKSFYYGVPISDESNNSLNISRSNFYITPSRKTSLTSVHRETNMSQKSQMKTCSATKKPFTSNQEEREAITLERADFQNTNNNEIKVYENKQNNVESIFEFQEENYSNLKNSFKTSGIKLLLIGANPDVKIEDLKEILEIKSGVQIINIDPLRENALLLEVEDFKVAQDAIQMLNGKKIEMLGNPLNITLSTESALKLCEMQLKGFNEPNMTEYTSFNHYEKKRSDESVVSNGKNSFVNKKTAPVKLVIEGLPWKINYDDLFNVFSRYGRVENIQIIRSGKNRSENFAFVYYTKKSMALNAIRCLDGHYKIHDSLKPMSLKLSNSNEGINNEFS